MNIDSIKNGIVIDHITAGRGMEIYRLLNLEELDCPVAIIKNVLSAKAGKKDIIKIDSEMPIDFNLLGYVDPGITVNIIKDSKVAEKVHPTLPTRLTGVLKCKNPRCITSTEQELQQIFYLDDSNNAIYRCLYCESKSDKMFNK